MINSKTVRFWFLRFVINAQYSKRSALKEIEPSMVNIFGKPSLATMAPCYLFHCGGKEATENEETGAHCFQSFRRLCYEEIKLSIVYECFPTTNQKELWDQKKQGYGHC